MPQNGQGDQDAPTDTSGFRAPFGPPPGQMPPAAVPSGYGYGYPPPRAWASNGWAVAALVIGIVTLVLSPIPVLNQAGILLGFVGLGIGVVALVIGLRRHARVTMSAVGLGLVILGLISSFAFTAAYVRAIDDALAGAGVPTSVGSSPFSDESAPVVYTLEATGSASTGLVTWNNGEGGIEQDMSAPMPWTKQVTVDPARGRGTNFSVSSPSNGRASSYTVTCVIKRDGQVVDTQTSRGMIASASCQVF